MSHSFNCIIASNTITVKKKITVNGKKVLTIITDCDNIIVKSSLITIGGDVMIPAYPVFAGELAKRGYTKSEIAKKIGVSQRTFYSKFYGNTEFTFSEASTIQREFFPDIDAAHLFSKAQEISA